MKTIEINSSQITLTWDCEVCGHVEETKIEDLLISGIPYCTECILAERSEEEEMLLRVTVKIDL